MIKSKKQRFCCVETKQIRGTTLTANEYYSANRENENEYTISSEKLSAFRATREELLSCGYLC